MIRVRPFSPTDMPAVMQIVKRSLGETYPPSLYLTVHNLWREGFLVEQSDDEVVAFVAAVPSGPMVARVLMLAVLPEMRRMGHGQRLMSALYSSCLSRGCETVILEVRKSNVAAIMFYQREGFCFTGEIENFYSNGEGAYKMSKALSS